MHVDETLVRSVVEQVLSRLGGNGNGAPVGGGYQGRFGLFTDVDQAVAAAREAFERLSRRTLEDRKRIIAHIRRIAIDQCVELGTMEMEETKIGRLPHKIEKLKTLGERAPGVEFLRSEVFSGDHGLAVIEHAPFGVICGRHAGDALAAHDHRQRGEHDCRRQHGGVQPASQRAARGGRGRATLQRGDLPRPGARQPPVPDHRADPGDGQRPVQASRHQPDLRDRRAGRGPGGDAAGEAGDRRRARQSAGGGRRDGRPRPGRPLHHPGRGLRQQPAVHRREASLRRRADLRSADGRHGARRRGAAQRAPRSTP